MKAPTRRTTRALTATGLVGLTLLGSLSGCASDSTSSSSSSTTGSASASASALPANKATGTPVKIGFITMEGGAASAPMLRESAEASVKYVNENAGGVNGHPIDLDVCKQQEDPASATTCAHQMVEDKVSLVLVPAGAQGGVILPIVSGAQIPYVALSGASQAEMVTPTSFVLTGGLPATFSAMAATAAKSGVKKFAVISGDSGNFISQVKGVGEPIFKGAGIELVLVPVPLGTPDPTPQITAGLKGKPEAVTVLGDPSLCISSLKALQSAAPGISKYLVNSCMDPNVVKAVGAAGYAGSKSFGWLDSRSAGEEAATYRSVMAEYAPKTDPNGFGSNSYQLIATVARALKGVTGDLTPASVLAGLKAAKNVPLAAGGGVKITCNGSALATMKMTSVCSKQVLLAEVDDKATPGNFTVVNQ